MMIDVDWVYREFLRRGYKQEYAADFLDQAWKNSDNTETRQRTTPDVFPFPPPGLVSELQEAAYYYANANDPNLRQQSDLCTRAAEALAQRPEESKLIALLREALEVLPGRGNLRRRIIQTLDHGSDMNVSRQSEDKSGS